MNIVLNCIGNSLFNIHKYDYVSIVMKKKHIYVKALMYYCGIMNRIYLRAFIVQGMQ